MPNLPETPISSGAVLVGVGVLAVTSYFIKKSSDDRQHLINTQLEQKKIDAEQQTAMLTRLQEMTTKSLG